MRNRYRIIGNVVTIELKRKQGRPLFAYVDRSDLMRLRELDVTWCAMRDYTVKAREKYYVMCHVQDASGRRTLLLHRFIMDARDGEIIDHVDGNTLNCRRGNLRRLTVAENAQNRAGAELRSKTGIRGVSWDKRKQRWRAKVKLNGKTVYDRLFATVEEAELEVKKVRARLMPFSPEARQGLT